MRPRVLIVEDSAIVVSAIRLLLEETGFHVDDAGGVSDAVARCRDIRPDIMLLDLGLRDGSGFDVLAALSSGAELPRVVIAVTGDDAPEVRERCLSHGCVDVLVKPIRPLDLPRQLRSWLSAAPGE